MSQYGFKQVASKRRQDPEYNRYLKRNGLQSLNSAGVTGQK